MCHTPEHTPQQLRWWPHSGLYTCGSTGLTMCRSGARDTPCAGFHAAAVIVSEASTEHHVGWPPWCWSQAWRLTDAGWREFNIIRILDKKKIPLYNFNTRKEKSIVAGVQYMAHEPVFSLYSGANWS